MLSHKEAIEAIEQEIVQPGQIWVGRDKDRIIRRIRILAKYPDSEQIGNIWIYEELSGGIFRTEIGRLGRFPLYNLLRIFEREDEDE